MPLLAGLLVNLFVGIAAFVAQFVGKKMAFGIAAVTLFSTLTAALFALMRTTIMSLADAGTLSGIIADMFGFAIPPVAPACVSAIITVWTACTLYKWQSKALDLFIKA